MTPLERRARDLLSDLKLGMGRAANEERECVQRHIAAAQREAGQEAEARLRIVLREMCAFGEGWRQNWSEFDGRDLRDQLNGLRDWAQSGIPPNFTKGTEFLKQQCGD